MGCKNCRLITDGSSTGKKFFSLHDEQSLEHAAEHVGYACILYEKMGKEGCGWLRVLGHLKAAERHTVDWPDVNKTLNDTVAGWRSVPRKKPDWDALELLFSKTVSINKGKGEADET